MTTGIYAEMGSCGPLPDWTVGWFREGPDASVGIFGESWFHSDCDGHDTDSTELIECDVEVRRTGAVGAGIDRFTFWAYRVRCVSCGHALRWVERDWDPPDPLSEAERQAEEGPAISIEAWRQQ